MQRVKHGIVEVIRAWVRVVAESTIHHPGSIIADDPISTGQASVSGPVCVAIVVVIVAVVDLNLLVLLVVVAITALVMVDDGWALAADLEAGEAGVDDVVALDLVDIVLGEVLEHGADIEVFLH